MPYFINKVIDYSLRLNQSKSNRIEDLNPNERLLLVRKSERDVVVNIIRNNNTYYIIFRGSRLGNWYDNLRIKQYILPYMNMKSRIRVHKGFMDAYKSMRLSIIKWIEFDMDLGLTNNYKLQPIIVGGHSLGGALATLCAVDLQYNFTQLRVSCVTLGSPRVGNFWFYKSYNKRVPKTVRIVHGNDIVTRLPPAWLFYKHVGKRLHQGNKWKFWLLPWGSIRDHLAYEAFK